ncbi:hypothetical protein [Tissierella sp.]|uniref:hypothetical protein n=1 Tax=Tissierella sp. TaxID=41274 RepID=UPI003041DCC7
MEKETYLNFKELNSLYSNIQKGEFQKHKDFKNFFLEKVNEFIEDLQEDKVTDEFIKYRLGLILLNMSENILENRGGHSFGFGYIKKEMENGKRTGILASILTNEDYLFYYNSDKLDKKGRMYYTLSMDINNEHKVITFVINSKEIEGDYLTETLFEIIQYFFTVYNNVFLTK